MKEEDKEQAKGHKAIQINEIIQSLNRQTDRLDAEILQQLRSARIKALSHYRKTNPDKIP